MQEIETSHAVCATAVEASVAASKELKLPHIPATQALHAYVCIFQGFYAHQRGIEHLCLLLPHSQ